MTDEEFCTMRDIGHEYGCSSHDLGRYLTQHGYRAEKKPSANAFAAGMVRQRFDSSGHYIWAWHVGKTRQFLESIGRKRRQRDGQTATE